MNRTRIAEIANKIAKELVADYEYIYDPDHKKHPGGGYQKTEKGWQKGKEENPQKKVNPYPASNCFDNARVTDDPKLLEKLSKHEHYRIRENVVHNPHTPEHVLRNLGSDDAFQVRAQVAGNRRTPQDVLEKLSHEKENYILGNLSHNPNATPKILKNVATNASERYILEDLSTNPNMQVRMQVAHNHNTGKDTLAQLANDKERQVRWDVAENPNTTTETLDKLANDDDTDILEGVAGNPNTSVETLEKLSNHEHPYVSQKAKQTFLQKESGFDISKLSPEIREKVKDWDIEEIKKFIGFLKNQK